MLPSLWTEGNWKKNICLFPQYENVGMRKQVENKDDYMKEISYKQQKKKTLHSRKHSMSFLIFFCNNLLILVRKLLQIWSSNLLALYASRTFLNSESYLTQITVINTAQKMKFSIKDLLRKFLTENFIFCTVKSVLY